MPTFQPVVASTLLWRNHVRNPRAVLENTGSYFQAGNTAGATVEQTPIRSTAWNRYGFGSFYYRVLNPDATGRTLAIRTSTALSNRFPVTPGRRYFAAVDANVIERPTHGTSSNRLPRINIVWMTSGGGTASTVSGNLIDLGEGRSIVSAVAPSDAASAYVRIFCTSAAGSPGTDRFEVYVDGWMFVEAEEADLDFFDGRSISGEFEGAPDDSISALYTYFRAVAAYHNGGEILLQGRGPYVVSDLEAHVLREAFVRAAVLRET